MKWGNMHRLMFLNVAYKKMKKKKEKNEKITIFFGKNETKTKGSIKIN